MAELLRRVAKFYYTDSNLGFTINFYPYIFAGIFTIGSILLLGWILGFLEFDLARVLNDELGFAGGLSSYINNYGTSFTSAGYDELSGDPLALLQSQVLKNIYTIPSTAICMSMLSSAIIPSFKSLKIIHLL